MSYRTRNLRDAVLGKGSALEIPGLTGAEAGERRAAYDGCVCNHP